MLVLLARVCDFVIALLGNLGCFVGLRLLGFLLAVTGIWFWFIWLLVRLCWWVCWVNCCGLLDMLVIVIACGVILALLMLISSLVFVLCCGGWFCVVVLRVPSEDFGVAGWLLVLVVVFDCVAPVCLWCCGWFRATRCSLCFDYVLSMLAYGGLVFCDSVVGCGGFGT